VIRWSLPTPSEVISTAKRKPKRSRAATECFRSRRKPAPICLRHLSCLCFTTHTRSEHCRRRSRISQSRARAQLWLAVLFTIISYTLLAGYDALALRQLKVTISAFEVVLASFTSYAISFTLGFPILTAGTVRYRIYRIEPRSGIKSDQSDIDCWNDVHSRHGDSSWALDFSGNRMPSALSIDSPIQSID